MRNTIKTTFVIEVRCTDSHYQLDFEGPDTTFTLKVDREAISAYYQDEIYTVFAGSGKHWHGFACVVEEMQRVEDNNWPDNLKVYPVEV